MSWILQWLIWVLKNNLPIITDTTWFSRRWDYSSYFWWVDFTVNKNCTLKNIWIYRADRTYTEIRLYTVSWWNLNTLLESKTYQSWVLEYDFNTNLTTWITYSAVLYSATSVAHTEWYSIWWPINRTNASFVNARRSNTWTYTSYQYDITHIKTQ